MDISTASIKTPEPETESQTRIQPAKQLLTTNGVLKRHHLNPAPQPTAAVVTYKECLKNHAATMGGHAVDGCGEFMPAPSSDPTNPTSLKCAACGCHRNFHRLDTDQPPPPSSIHQIIEYKPHHRHHPPPPPPHLPPRGSPTKSNSASPPPISSSYMLLALSGGGGGGGGGGLPGGPPQETGRLINHSGSNLSGRKRFRTKFSQNQKEKMLEFAERVGWKMQRKDEELISGFCSEIGVEKGVFKVWMHNNKSTFGKNSINKVNHHHLLHHNNGNGNGNGVNFGNTVPESANFHHHQENNNNGSSQVSGHEEGVVANGSSSSS